MELIAIIPFYNFFDNQKYTENHYRMIEDLERRQQVPHLTLEVGLMGQYKLQKDDNVLQFPTQSILWHKEALINLGAKMMKDRYSYIAWIDSGLLLEDGWADKAINKLQKCDLIHCYSVGEYLDDDGRCKAICNSHFAGGRNLVPGGALSAKSDFFDEIGLYPYCVIGGGDSYLVELLNTNNQFLFNLMSKAQQSHYMTWLEKVRKARLSTGYIDGKFCHLWHGSMVGRYYGPRHEILISNNYNPEKDVVLSDGILEWTNNNTKLQQEVLLYFGSRR